MASPVQLVSNQKLPVGFAAIDQGGELFASVPPGHIVEIASSDPAIVGVTMRPDGLNADLSSDGIGVALITATFKDANGVDLPGSPETLEVTVINAPVGSVAFTVGAPEPE